MRGAQIARKTAETDLLIALNLDGEGKSEIDTGCGFLNHMLTLFAKHARFDLKVKCVGDTDVDDHHTVEDIGIALGTALKDALGDKRGIIRYGSMLLPMDEALILCALDLSGRGYIDYGLTFQAEKVGTFDTELGREFFTALAMNAGMTLHLKQLAGLNAHHILEGAFKATARALRQATAVDAAFANDIPSTKGVL